MTAGEYTQAKFEEDLKALGLSLENDMKGGKKAKKSSKKSKTVLKKKSTLKKKKTVLKKKSSLKKKSGLKKKKTVLKKKSALKKKSGLKKKSSKKMSSMKGGKNNNNNNNNKNNQRGGKIPDSINVRHFKISELNGKTVDFGSAEIKASRTPLSAAKKLLKSIAHHMKLYKSNKLKLSATFKIRETTRGHAKEYGPYTGSYHKYTNSELKDAKTKGGKIMFTMKPIVKKLKRRSGNQKGGR